MLQQIRDRISGWFAAFFLGAIAVVFIFWGIQFESSVDRRRRQGQRREHPRRARAPGLAGPPDRAAAAVRDELPPELVKSEQQKLSTSSSRRELLVQRAARIRLPRQRPGAGAGRCTTFQPCRSTASSHATATRRCCASRVAARPSSSANSGATSRRRSCSNAIARFSVRHAGRNQAPRRLEGETREVPYAVLPAASVRRPGVGSPAGEVAAYYAQHKSEFMTPETVRCSTCSSTSPTSPPTCRSPRRRCASTTTRTRPRALREPRAAPRQPHPDRIRQRRRGGDRRKPRQIAGRGQGRRGLREARPRELRRPRLEGGRRRSRLGDAREPTSARFADALFAHAGGRDPRPGQDAVRLPRDPARGVEPARAAQLRGSARRARGRVPARAGPERCSTRSRSSSPTNRSRR